MHACCACEFQDDAYLFSYFRLMQTRFALVGDRDLLISKRERLEPWPRTDTRTGQGAAFFIPGAR